MLSFSIYYTFFKTNVISQDLRDYLSSKLALNDETVLSLVQTLEWSSNEAAFLEKIKELYHSEVKALSNISTESSLQTGPRPSSIIIPLQRSLKHIGSVGHFKTTCSVKQQKKEKMRMFLLKSKNRKFDSDDENENENESDCSENEEKRILQQLSKRNNMYEKNWNAKECKGFLKNEMMVFEREREAHEEMNEFFSNDELMFEENLNENMEEGKLIPVIERVARRETI